MDPGTQTINHIPSKNKKEQLKSLTLEKPNAKCS
jgi:hypothetical protein